MYAEDVRRLLGLSDQDGEQNDNGVCCVVGKFLRLHPPFCYLSNPERMNWREHPDGGTFYARLDAMKEAHRRNPHTSTGAYRRWQRRAAVERRHQAAAKNITFLQTYVQAVVENAPRPGVSRTIPAPDRTDAGLNSPAILERRLQDPEAAPAALG